jgi:hypothetical protein
MAIKKATGSPLSASNAPSAADVTLVVNQPSVELTRGINGGYNVSVKAFGATTSEARNEAEAIFVGLCKKYPSRA